MFITDKYSDCRTLMDSGTEPALKRFWESELSGWEIALIVVICPLYVVVGGMYFFEFPDNHSLDLTCFSSFQVTYVDFGSSVVVSLHKLRRLFPKVIHLFWISKTFRQAWLWLSDRVWLWSPFKNIICSVHVTSGYCSTSHYWGKRWVWENLKKNTYFSAVGE